MSLWDADQREWLQAMGYSLLVLADDEAAEPTAKQPRAAGSDAGHGDDGDGVPSGAAGRRPVDTGLQPPRADRVRAAPALPAASDAAEASPPESRPRTDAAAKAAALEAARAGASGRYEGPLWDALLSATGQPPALAARTLRELGVDLVALRADPTAKRALWPHLRRLRRPATP